MQGVFVVSQSTGRRRDASRTKSAILNAAIAEFSARGPAGTRMDEVAARAGVNKSLIYQYYGSKQELYAEALNNVLVMITDRLTTGAKDFLSRMANEPIESALRVLIESQLTMLETFPEYPRLMAWENLEGGRTLSRLQLQNTYQMFLHGVTRFIKPYQEAGVISPDLDLIQFVQSIQALLHYYVIQKGTQEYLFKLDINMRETREAWIDTVTTQLLSSLKGQKVSKST
ncbi:MAG: TetR/AcrR family transcriptional regulator [Planctomycetota bacterium]